MLPLTVRHTREWHRQWWRSIFSRRIELVIIFNCVCCNFLEIVGWRRLLAAYIDSRYELEFIYSCTYRYYKYSIHDVWRMRRWIVFVCIQCLGFHCLFGAEAVLQSPYIIALFNAHTAIKYQIAHSDKQRTINRNFSVCVFGLSFNCITLAMRFSAGIA